MKILHALVGYLAVTALPFPSPFALALALPLAAISNIDGYVNTSQDHIQVDDALPDANDIIEARQLETVDALLIFDIVATVFTTVIWISGDDQVRADVEFLVDHFD